MEDFKDIKYLKTGNERQQAAYKVLTESRILERVSAYDPLLVGTVPINIDIDSSDLDIICHCTDIERFADVLTKEFQAYEGFEIHCGGRAGEPYVVGTFYAEGFCIEVFGQNIPVANQNAYKHMLTEHAILEEKGESFRQAVLGLKISGIKTEPAFAELLGLDGDPYEALLEYEINSQKED